MPAILRLLGAPIGSGGMYVSIGYSCVSAMNERLDALERPKGCKSRLLGIPALVFIGEACIRTTRLIRTWSILSYEVKSSGRVNLWLRNTSLQQKLGMIIYIK